METPDSLTPDYFLRSMQNIGILDTGRKCICGAKIFMSAKSRSDLACGNCDLQKHEAYIEAKVIRDMPRMIEHEKIRRENEENKKNKKKDKT